MLRFAARLICYVITKLSAHKGGIIHPALFSKQMNQLELTNIIIDKTLFPASQVLTIFLIYFFQFSVHKLTSISS